MTSCEGGGSRGPCQGVCDDADLPFPTEENDECLTFLIVCATRSTAGLRSCARSSRNMTVWRPPCGRSAARRGRCPRAKGILLSRRAVDGDGQDGEQSFTAGSARPVAPTARRSFKLCPHDLAHRPARFHKPAACGARPSTTCFRVLWPTASYASRSCPAGRPATTWRLPPPASRLRRAQSLALRSQVDHYSDGRRRDRPERRDGA